METNRAGLTGTRDGVNLESGRVVLDEGDGPLGVDLINEGIRGCDGPPLIVFECPSNLCRAKHFPQFKTPLGHLLSHYRLPLVGRKRRLSRGLKAIGCADGALMMSEVGQQPPKLQDSYYRRRNSLSVRTS